MSTLKTATKDELTAYGYIRENLDENSWIDEIVAIIIHFYLKQGGSLYVFGDGRLGRLGIHEYENGICSEPTLCPPFIDNNAQKISVSDDYSLILDIDGNVWCCGTNERGQLGKGKNIKYRPIPTMVNFGIRIISISAGKNHSLFLARDGWVYSSGSNQHGQLGLGLKNKACVFTPKMIEGLKFFNIVQISAGKQHSAALTENGVLFCFGYNGQGECGVGEGSGKTAIFPKMVQMNDKIDFIDCGEEHSLLITEKRSIYSFGCSAWGCLGHGNDEDCYVPKAIEALKGQRMKTCAAGSFHSICFNDEGMVWAFGKNAYGESGVSLDNFSQETPRVIEYFISNNIKAKSCAAGMDTSCVIAENGCLYLFGLNDKCQLGMKRNGDEWVSEEKNSYYIPQKLCLPHNASVQSVSLGSSHGAVICNH